MTQPERNRRFRKYLNRIKRFFGCSFCPAKIGLEFHHEDPATKRNNIAWMANCSLETLWEEIGKCVLVCRKCHQGPRGDARNYKTLSRVGHAARYGGTHE